MEGRFSIVYAIAGVYLEVSKKYIIPGINQMEQLAIMPLREYNQQIGEFKQWVIDAKAGIEGMSSKVSRLLIQIEAQGHLLTRNFREKKQKW